MARLLVIIADRTATSLEPGLINAARDLAGGGETVTLSPGEAVEMLCPNPPDEAALRALIAGRPIDAAFVASRGRRKGLLVADMDSTIVTGETLDELAAEAGFGARVAAITKRSMNGEIDFEQALRERVAMLKGLGLDALERTWAGVRLTEGARTLVATMRAHGALTALVSGGFDFFTERVATLCGFDRHHANRLVDDGTALTGAVAEPILDRGAKLAMLEALAAERRLRLAATAAVGDGANDLAMIEAAGLGVAFHAKPVVAKTARVRLDHVALDGLLFLQGYSRAQFRDQ